jgi:hypothetical protein
MKNYTHNWNQEFITNSKSLNLKFDFCLEIGSFEGLTSNFIVDNILNTNGKLICIDPLTDVYLNDNLSEFDKERNDSHFAFFKDQYSRFINNVREHIETGKIELIKDLSINVFDDLIDKYKNKFDFIYIDGDHRPEGVYIDAVNSFILCKNGGYILFDDYLWENTGVGIDRFLKEYNGKYLIITKGFQVLIKIIKYESN